MSAESHRTEIERLLVAVDFSAVTARVVEEAAALAGTARAEVFLLHVAAPDPEFVGYDAGPKVVRQQVASELRQEHRDIQAMAADLRGRGIAATALLVQGPTVKTILDEAKRLGVRWIVVGSHGHGAVYRTLLGSISEGVLHAAPCPVLIVPAR